MDKQYINQQRNESKNIVAEAYDHTVDCTR